MRHLYTAAEAAKLWGIPAARIRQAASRVRADGTRRLYHYGLDEHGRKMYDRDDLLELSEHYHSIAGERLASAAGTALNRDVDNGVTARHAVAHDG